MSYIYIPEISPEPHWVSDEIPEDAVYYKGFGSGGGWNTGIPHSEETKKKMSEVRTGKKQSKETIQKRLNAITDHSHSEETKRKISKTLTGRKLSEETKQKLSLALKGRVSPNKGRKYKQKKRNE